MLTIAPFRALMPEPDQAARVAALPYDVMSRDRARQLAGDNPLSFLRVSRPEIELDPSVDAHADATYQRAAANFVRLQQSAPLVLDERDAYYIYATTFGSHRQVGLVAAFSVDDYDESRIMQHEKTRLDKEEDRTRHLMATRAHSGPVFLVCRESWAMTSAMQEIMAADKPHFDVVAEDSSRHQVWRVPAQYDNLLTMVFRKMKAIYIADGHHRAKSASRARALCRDANPNHTGNEPYNRFLGVVFPHTQVRILAYNRLVHDLNGLTANAFLDRVREHFGVAPTDHGTPDRTGRIHLYLGGVWYRLTVETLPADTSPIARLDVSILQDRLLGPVLGIDDPRTSERISFVGGIHGCDGLTEPVDRGDAAIAFSMYPTTVDQLMQIAERHEIMPPKSTWFEPKLRDGLLIHPF